MLNPSTTWFPVVDHLVGVIDLKAGVAVHAVAGHRQLYTAIRLPQLGDQSIETACDGDAIELVSHYRSIGVRQFYIADLDVLQGGQFQQAELSRILNHALSDERWVLDLGLNERSPLKQLRWMRDQTSSKCEGIQWVIASESAINLQTPGLVYTLAGLGSLAEAAFVLGIDFRGGVFNGPELIQEAPTQRDSDRKRLDRWLEAGDAAGIASAILLDVATVGTGSGPTTASACEYVRHHYPHWQLMSGGGCRDIDDVATLMTAGCNDCMVATALLRSIN